VALDKIRERWSWATDPTLRPGTDALLAWGATSLGQTGTPTVILGPGYALPRTFLELYATANVCESGHDEVRLPLYAKHLNFGLTDNGLYPSWFDAEVERTFNADEREIELFDAYEELRKRTGRRAFHPCRERYTAEVVEELSALAWRERAE
jgi:hypothetical protein